MTYRFKVAELISGKVLDELPFTIDGDLTRGLQMYGEGTLSLPLFDGQGEIVSDTWEQAILPWRSLILIVDEQDRIVWHGIPTRRGRGMGSTVRFPCRTIEAYLVRRYVPTLTFKQQDQTSVIFKTLVQVAGASIGLEYDCPPSGVLRDHNYADDENARVYDRINELAALLNGFNWTVDVVWGDDAKSFVRKIVRTGYPYLGNRSANPVHVFELGQNVTDFSFDEPWEEGDAATHVTAVGEGEADSKVMSAPVIDTVREAAGWPRLEERRSFSNVSVQATIDSHAGKVADQLFGGQHILTLTARNPGKGEDFTRLGDLTLGDTARAIIEVTHQQDDDEPPIVLWSIKEVWPVVGWSLTPQTGVYKPALAKIGN